MADFKLNKIMNFIRKIWIYLFLLSSTIVLGQTPGFNYQALILNTVEVQIPGTNAIMNKVPLSSEDITLRFTITNEAGIEYIEEHNITTDENGMVSLIVGEGTPISFTFDDIIWDGKLKYLNVELDILSNNEGFVFLDTQKILYIPHTTSIRIIETVGDINPPYKMGDLIWIKNYGPNKMPTLMIWEGENWTPVNEDYDPTNEFGLITVSNDIARNSKFQNPVIGDQVWNQSDQCIQVYDGSEWVSISSKALNGLYNDNSTIKLGGVLTEPTTISSDATNTIAFKGLQVSANNDDQVIVADKNTGVLKQKALSSLSEKKQIIVIAIDGQLEFNTPLNITSKDKIDVFRNGVRINFTTLNSTTIKLEQEAQCYQNDEIRIVQLY
jgi:hypothetical protein